MESGGGTFFFWRYRLKDLYQLKLEFVYKCPECSETEIKIIEDRVIMDSFGMISSQRLAGRLSD